MICLKSGARRETRKSRESHVSAVDPRVFCATRLHHVLLATNLNAGSGWLSALRSTAAPLGAHRPASQAPLTRRKLDIGQSGVSEKVSVVLNPYWKWFNRVITSYRPVPGPVAGSDVIVGYAKGYRLSDLHAFVTTAEQNVGVPFILVGSLPQEEQRIVEAKGGQLIEPWPGNGWQPVPILARVVETLCVLRSLGRNVERVLWCDTRDLVFQRNPFRSAFDADIIFHSENTSPRLGDTATGKWLAQILGEDALGPIADRPMANAGVIFARRKAMEDLLSMVAILAGTAKHRLMRLRAFASDQALFNYVAHHELAGSTVVARNLGRVANLIGVEPERLPIRDGLLCAPDTGEPFDIVHMFDRNPETSAWAREQFGWSGDEVNDGPPLAQMSARLKASIIKRLPEIRF